MLTFFQKGLSLVSSKYRNRQEVPTAEILVPREQKEDPVEMKALNLVDVKPSLQAINEQIKHGSTQQELSQPKKQAVIKILWIFSALGTVGLSGGFTFVLMRDCNEMYEARTQVHEEANNFCEVLKNNCNNTYSKSGTEWIIVPDGDLCTKDRSGKIYDYFLMNCSFVDFFESSFKPNGAEANHMRRVYGECARSIYDRLANCDPKRFSEWLALCESNASTTCTMSPIIAAVLTNIMIFIPLGLYKRYGNNRKNSILRTPLDTFGLNNNLDPELLKRYQSADGHFETVGRVKEDLEELVKVQGDAEGVPLAVLLSRKGFLTFSTDGAEGLQTIPREETKVIFQS